ncbi:hypothetical protein Srufu_078890 [Streptomyces libani subsp. rufus]|nr:hypothetical protein Srufu_000090 [Streptomyces libani subsp. rufus]BCK73936.1 hypothetical protein Srufu_078890 [Streptomyces libani subsp. rufus]
MRRRLARGPRRPHVTRAAVTAPAVRATVLLPALADAAKTAADAAYDMRNATDHAALDTARTRANNAALEAVGRGAA